MQKKLYIALMLLLALVIVLPASATYLETATVTADCTKFTLNVKGGSLYGEGGTVSYIIGLYPASGQPIIIQDSFIVYPDANNILNGTVTRPWSDFGVALTGTYGLGGSATITSLSGQYGNFITLAFSPSQIQNCTPPPPPLKTFTQGGWGADPSGNNPGELLHSNFANLYPNGVYVGGNYKLTFTSAQAITNFLPQGGKPNVLTANATNPLTSAAQVFAGQVLALQLNVDFSQAGITPTGLGDRTITTSVIYGLPNPGPLAGKKVSEVLALANQVLGGNTGALPAGYNVSWLNSIVDTINNNYDNGNNLGFLQ